MSGPAAPSSPRRRRRLLWGAVLLASLLAVDLARAPASQWSNRVLLASVRAYRAKISPHFARRCRFTPSCSEYALAVLAHDGALVGSLRAGWRIVRCGPWTPRGTVDRPEPSGGEGATLAPTSQPPSGSPAR